MTIGYATFVKWLVCNYVTMTMILYTFSMVVTKHQLRACA